MSKKLKVVSSIIVVGILLVLALPYYMGIKAKQTLDKQYALLQNSVFLEVVEHKYTKGWFSSEEVTSVRIKPSVVDAYKGMLPDALRNYAGKTVTYTNHIYHGPFPRFNSVGRAYVETEFQYSAELKKELERFFKEQAPIVLRNKIDFSGGGKLTLSVPSFDYSELSGIKINWQGFDYSIDYKKEFSNYLSEASAPSLEVILADKGEIKFKGFSYKADNELSATGADLGSNAVKLDQLAISWTDSVDYYININEVVNLLSNMQVGAFINPRGKIGPSQLELNHLALGTVTTEKDGFLNWDINAKFDQLKYGQEVFGPMSAQVSANHFEGKSFLALTEKLKNIAALNLSAEDANKAVVKAAKTEGLTFLSSDPQIDVKEFKLKMPSGLLDVHGSFALKGLKIEDMDDMIGFLSKVDVNMEGYIPQEALESMAVSNAQAIFKPDERVADQPDMDDIARSVKALMQYTIDDWAEKGFIIVDKGIVYTKINRKNGILHINGRKVVFEYEDEDALFNDQDNENASGEQVVASAPPSNEAKPSTIEAKNKK